MFRSPWSRNLLGRAFSRQNRRRSSQSRKPVRLMVESLEERLTPSGGTVTQTAGSYTALTGLIGGDTNASTNYVINLTSSFRFASGGQVTVSKLGAGSTLTIEGQNGSNFDLIGNGNRLFDITSGQNVTFKDLTLTQGLVENASTAQGGAILDNGGNVVLNNVIVGGNLLESDKAQGGGICVNGGSLTLENGCAILSNRASGLGGGTSLQMQGGGIYVNGGRLTVEGGCTIQSNRVGPVQGTAAGAVSQGGGVFVTGASTVQIADSVIHNNSVTGFKGRTAGNYTGMSQTAAAGGLAAGGGLFVVGNGWTVTLTGDTLSGNKAVGGAGGKGETGTLSSPGLANGGAGGEALGGGAAFEVGSGAGSSTLTILNDPSHPSTILDNSVQGGAGGTGGAAYSTSNTANGGQGGMGGSAIGGGVAITNQGGSLTANIGNTTFYGNQATAGNGGAGGTQVGSGTAGAAGLAGSGIGGGLAIPVQFGSDNVTMVNSTVAANSVHSGHTGGGSVGGTAGGGGVALAMSSGTSPTFTLDNNTITQNTIGGANILGGAGVAFEIIPPPLSPPPTTSGNLVLFNNLIQSNDNGSAEADLFSFGPTTGGTSDIALTNATNNFIGTISTNAVSTTSNIVGNTQLQLGNAVGVDSQGNPTGGPIYYPLASGVSSIGYGTTSVLSTIASVEGTATATDAIGNPMPSAGPINLGAVQVVLPGITQQPSSQTVTTGANVSFTAAASGTPTPTVQWQISTDGGQSWTNITGATGTTLTLSNVGTALNGHEYRAVFSNSCGDASTNAVTLTVHAPAPPPAPLVLHVPPLLALFDSLLGGVETVNANGTETIADRLLGFPLLVSTYDSQGNLESVLFLGINVTLVFELL